MSTTSKSFPTWVFLLLIANGILMLAVMLLILRQHGTAAFVDTQNSQNQVNLATQNQELKPQLGPRHNLNYQQWLDVLKQEAEAATSENAKNLTVLAGDSLSMWFPPELLPEEKTWLNQGVSGESSAGLLKRLKIFDRTQPKTIFVMIGINDLIRGVEDEQILENHRQIMKYLKKKHPKAQIVVQSILPHGDESITWEGREKLLAVPNNRIRILNQQLQSMTKQEGVKFLNLHPLFTDREGNLRSLLSTDGLHLNSQGYLVWRSALKMWEIGE
ncbi:MAG: G-D-S-L family lipolytic protein [Scytonematopsis contorta HA4267-MV1]|nr:G-D-S-L family lipolytic protein [Scytonematopsis contorta HA4267-MV1]